MSSVCLIYCIHSKFATRGGGNGRRQTQAQFNGVAWTRALQNIETFLDLKSITFIAIQRLVHCLCLCRWIFTVPQGDFLRSHAEAAIKSHERERLEKLVRYMARPAISDERVVIEIYSHQIEE